MIAIINDGSNPSTTGVHRYKVQINDKVICGFSHVREEGLEVCLLKAAEAVRRAQAQAHWAGDVNDPRHPDHHKTRVASPKEIYHAGIRDMLNRKG